MDMIAAVYTDDIVFVETVDLNEWEAAWRRLFDAEPPAEWDDDVTFVDTRLRRSAHRVLFVRGTDARIALVRDTAILPIRDAAHERDADEERLVRLSDLLNRTADALHGGPLVVPCDACSTRRTSPTTAARSWGLDPEVCNPDPVCEACGGRTTLHGLRSWHDLPERAMVMRAGEDTLRRCARLHGHPTADTSTGYDLAGWLSVELHNARTQRDAADTRLAAIESHATTVLEGAELVRRFRRFLDREAAMMCFDDTNDSDEAVSALSEYLARVDALVASVVEHRT